MECRKLISGILLPVNGQKYKGHSNGLYFHKMKSHSNTNNENRTFIATHDVADESPKTLFRNF